MMQLLRRASMIGGGVLLVLILFAIGTAFGVGQHNDDLRKFWFEVFGLLGTWISGLGALAAAYAALHIADKQRQDKIFDDKVRCLSHTMAIVNDLRGRLHYIRRVLDEGGRPLVVLTNTGAGLIRRYEVLFDRDLYSGLSGPIIDRITTMSGDFAGIQSSIDLVSSRMEHKADQKLPPKVYGSNAPEDFERLGRELDDLFSALDAEFPRQRTR